MSKSRTPLKPQDLPVKTHSSDNIRHRVDDRHWALFELRLKSPLTEDKKENYTKSNDYGIRSPWKKVDQSPIEPNQRWQTFCSKLTKTSNESNRLMYIFHNVWINDWNKTETTQKPSLNSSQSTPLENVIVNERDKKILSSILHRNV